MKISPGEIVGIQGLGGLGHLALQYAAKMGYRVVALSSSGSKESFARDLGAHDYVDGSKTDQGEYLKKLGGAGLIVSTAPNPDVIGQLLSGLAPLGKLLILSGKSHHLQPNCRSTTQARIHQWRATSKSVPRNSSRRGFRCMDGHPDMRWIRKKPSVSHRFTT